MASNSTEAGLNFITQVKPTGSSDMLCRFVDKTSWLWDNASSALDRLCHEEGDFSRGVEVDNIFDVLGVQVSCVNSVRVSAPEHIGVRASFDTRSLRDVVVPAVNASQNLSACMAMVSVS